MSRLHYICKNPFCHLTWHNHRSNTPSRSQVLPTLKGGSYVRAKCHEGRRFLPTTIVVNIRCSLKNHYHHQLQIDCVLVWFCCLKVPSLIYCRWSGSCLPKAESPHQRIPRIVWRSIQEFGSNCRYYSLPFCARKKIWIAIWVLSDQAQAGSNSLIPLLPPVWFVPTSELHESAPWTCPSPRLGGHSGTHRTVLQGHASWCLLGGLW